MSETEGRDVPAVQQAMKVLSLYINSTDDEVKRLSAAERHLSGRNEMLASQVAGAERQLIDSREEVRRLLKREKDLEGTVRELNTRVERGDDDLRRRAEEAEGRADVYGQQNEELTDKANLGVRLSEAARKMIDAIDRLPTKMEEATPIRTSAESIELYATYEWQAVTDAKLLLARAMGDLPEEEAGEESA